MSLRDIKTEALIVELIERCSDQLLDPEPMYDGVLSYVSREDLENVMDELQNIMPSRRISLRSEDGKTERYGV